MPTAVLRDEYLPSLEDITEAAIYESSQEEGVVGAQIKFKSAKREGEILLSAPAIIAAIAEGKSPKKIKEMQSKTWTSLTEILTGIDTQGIYAENEPVIIVVHGGGLLTYDKLVASKSGGLNQQKKVFLKTYEWNKLLKGKLHGAEIEIPVYPIERISEIKDPIFGRYAVIIKLDDAKASCGAFDRNGFIGNKLALAIAGTGEYLGKYFDAANLDGKITVNENITNCDPNKPSGSFAYILKSMQGIAAPGLDLKARYISIGPKLDK